MKNGFIFFMLIAVIIVAACTGSKSAITPVKGLSFLVNEKVNYEHLSITLTQIQESRCPLKVQCIRAGEAIAYFNVVVNGKSERNIELCTGADCDRRGLNTQYLLSSEEMKYQFILDSITPYPTQTPDKKPARAYIRIVQSN